MDSAEERPLSIVRVPKELVEEIWPQVCGYLEAAIPKRPRLFTIEHVKEKLVAGRGTAELWIVIEQAGKSFRVLAAAVCYIASYPLVQALKIWLLGGTEMKRWREMLEAYAKDYALSKGCSLLEGADRIGWKRFGDVIDIGHVLFKEIV